MARKKPTINLAPAERPNNGSKFHFSFANQYQKDAYDTIMDARNELIILLGEAGTGKTFLSTVVAAQLLLEKSPHRKIHLTRPFVTTENIGHLPGTLEEKVSPLLQPFMDILDTVCPPGSDRKKIEEAISFEGLGFLRGRNFNYCTAILDEAQNATWDQLTLFVTRLGKRCKMIVQGDPMQSDLRQPIFTEFIRHLSKVEGVKIISLPPAAQCRNPIVSRILEALPKPSYVY